MISHSITGKSDSSESLMEKLIVIDCYWLLYLHFNLKVYFSPYRHRKSKSPKPYMIDEGFDVLKAPKSYHESNPAYRHSTDGKRLLSTNSNASSERYSVVPSGKNIIM